MHAGTAFIPFPDAKRKEAGAPSGYARRYRLLLSFCIRALPHFMMGPRSAPARQLIPRDLTQALRGISAGGSCSRRWTPQVPSSVARDHKPGTEPCPSRHDHPCPLPQRPTRVAMATYLVLNYSGEGPQSDKDWTALFSRLEAAKALRGGSALGKRLGFDGTSDVAVTAREVGGYFIISALSVDEVKVLMKDSPIIRSGGHIDILELVKD